MNHYKKNVYFKWAFKYSPSDKILSNDLYGNSITFTLLSDCVLDTNRNKEFVLWPLDTSWCHAKLWFYKIKDNLIQSLKSKKIHNIHIVSPNKQKIYTCRRPKALFMKVMIFQK